MSSLLWKCIFLLPPSLLIHSLKGSQSAPPGVTSYSCLRAFASAIPSGWATKGTFHEKTGTIKDRNGMDLTEAEDIKKRWQEYTKELYKKIS